MRYLIVLLLALALIGCKKKEPDAPKDVAAKDNPAPQPNKDNEHIRFRPPGGSSTILGKSRDRALDTEIMNELRQIKIVLMTDYPTGGCPADKKGWLTLLRDFRQVRGLIDRDEMITFSPPRLGDPNTVLMYEKRVVDENDGIVLTADGTPHRMNKEQFEKLTKPAR